MSPLPAKQWLLKYSKPSGRSICCRRLQPENAPPENSLDRPRQDHLRDGRVLKRFLADADDRQPADLRRNDDTLRIKPGVGRDSEPLADQLLQRTQENIIRLMSLRILRASYRAFFSSGSVL